MIIGYARVSTKNQIASGQIDALEKYGCERIFTDQASGKTTQRPELKRLLDTLRDSDIVVVQRLDRLGRSLKDLIELLDSFRERDIQFVSLVEGIDTTTATGELTFNLIASIAQFERRLISERTKIGLDAARARGRLGGRKRSLTDEQVQMARAMLSDPDMTKKAVSAHFGVCRVTLDRYLAQEKK